MNRSEIKPGKEYYYAFMGMDSSRPAMYRVKAINIADKHNKRFLKFKVIEKFFDYFGEDASGTISLFVDDIYRSFEEALKWYKENGLTEHKLIDEIFK